MQSVADYHKLGPMQVASEEVEPHADLQVGPCRVVLWCVAGIEASPRSGVLSIACMVVETRGCVAVTCLRVAPPFLIELSLRRKRPSGA
jgi:hypothetical protein